MAGPLFVATDLDGTLIRSDGTVSARTCQALARVEAAGSTVVFVTGRPTRVMADVVAQTGASGLAICGNGAVTYNLDTGDVVEQHHLTAPAALRLAAIIRRLMPEAAFAVESGQRFGREPEFMTHWPDPGELVGPLAELVDQLPVTKLLVRVAGRQPAPAPLSADRPSATAPFAEVWRQIAELARDDAVVTTSSLDLVEIAGVGVSKASALEGVVGARGGSAGDVIAFGDMPNDLPMLRWAGYAVAVANAHPDVLAAADEITASNDEDGVAAVLERLFP
ncbi:MAG: HAD-IIB family hydrolase [Frankia sp.]